MTMPMHRLWAGTALIVTAVVLREIVGGSLALAGVVLLGMVLVLSSFERQPAG